VRHTLNAAFVVACLFTITGCEWRGLNSLSLPGTEGGGDGSYTIQAQFARRGGHQQNTRVRVGDVNIGNVTKIEVQDWHALVTMRINRDVHLRRTAPQKWGRPVCLAPCTFELAPPVDQAPEGQLKDGSVIPLSAASTYPTTEQTLASCRSCSTAVGSAASGDQPSLRQGARRSENDMRSLLAQLDVFIAQLNDQTDDIISATEKLNSLAGQVAASDEVVDKGLPRSRKPLPCLRIRARNCGRDRRPRQVQCRRDVDGQPDQGFPRRQSAQHRAGCSASLPTPACPHQGTGLPLDVSVGEEHGCQLVSAATSPTSPSSST